MSGYLISILFRGIIHIWYRYSIIYGLHAVPPKWMDANKMSKYVAFHIIHIICNVYSILYNVYKHRVLFFLQARYMLQMIDNTMRIKCWLYIYSIYICLPPNQYLCPRPVRDRIGLSSISCLAISIYFYDLCGTYEKYYNVSKYYICLFFLSFLPRSRLFLLIATTVVIIEIIWKWKMMPGWQRNIRWMRWLYHGLQWWRQYWCWCRINQRWQHRWGRRKWRYGRWCCGGRCFRIQIRSEFIIIIIRVPIMMMIAGNRASSICCCRCHCCSTISTHEIMMEMIMEIIVRRKICCSTIVTIAACIAVHMVGSVTNAAAAAAISTNH